MRLYQQFLTRNSCFSDGHRLNIRGIMVHSTGANNPNLSRYVPGNVDIGYNTSGNHWNHSNAEWKKKFGQPLNKCVHAFIGKTKNQDIAVVQTLPWDMRGWHAGMSAGNSRYIGFEICEDGLADPEYFKQTYNTAVELTAMLCKKFGLNPLEDGVVICHAEGFQRGVASNHADVLHWWSMFGRTMDDFRADVARAMKEENNVPRYNTIAEIKQAASWAEPTIRKMIRKGFIAGSCKKDAQGLPADMNLSMDMIRMMVMLDTAGAFGK